MAMSLLMGETLRRLANHYAGRIELGRPVRFECERRIFEARRVIDFDEEELESIELREL
ncbi:MAG: hypothetical protein Q8K13_06440 [Parvibaculum sp.]|uniref:hypothetical protein n=1 Tax=Parvibaculum sp. TaxID=2024848 RepID=UPI002731731F|nr:hypothetical protein [Parvibaculum sp.]MDP2149267.1 hypothetical protein [Parvibaculum sp.]